MTTMCSTQPKSLALLQPAFTPSRRCRPALPPSDALLLGPTATQEAVFAALRQKYKDAQGQLAAANCFPLFPQLFAALDKDHSGEIDSREVLG